MYYLSTCYRNRTPTPHPMQVLIVICHSSLVTFCPRFSLPTASPAHPQHAPHLVGANQPFTPSKSAV